MSPQIVPIYAADLIIHTPFKKSFIEKTIKYKVVKGFTIEEILSKLKKDKKIGNIKKIILKVQLGFGVVE